MPEVLSGSGHSLSSSLVIVGTSEANQLGCSVFTCQVFYFILFYFYFYLWLLYSRKFLSAKNFVKSDGQTVRQEFIFVKCWLLLCCFSFIFTFMNISDPTLVVLWKNLVRNSISSKNYFDESDEIKFLTKILYRLLMFWFLLLFVLCGRKFCSMSLLPWPLFFHFQRSVWNRSRLSSDLGERLGSGKWPPEYHVPAVDGRFIHFRSCHLCGTDTGAILSGEMRPLCKCRADFKNRCLFFCVWKSVFEKTMSDEDCSTIVCWTIQWSIVSNFLVYVVYGWCYGQTFKWSKLDRNQDLFWNVQSKILFQPRSVPYFHD